jgi:transcriptional regulator with XRE-family HTH domain
MCYNPKTKEIIMIKKLLRELREKRGYSQQDLADKLDISRSSYINVENGKRELSLAEARTLANIYGITLEEVESGVASEYDKYREMIQYMVKKFPQGVPKTKLAKMLYLADFGKFYHTHSSMSGMQYRRIQFGPVPDQYFRALSEMQEEGLITNIESPHMDGKVCKITPTRGIATSRESLLSDDEKELLDEIFKRWSTEKTATIVSFTHNQLPYDICDEGEIIPYELIIQEDPDNVY